MQSDSGPIRSIRTQSANFVIPVGTQVVLKSAQPSIDGSITKPSGSVGVVLQSPPNNGEAYLLQFADGTQATALFDHLTLRRREVDELLGEVEEDLRPFVVYRCQVGSKAYGLSTENSDDDIRGIYLPPARLHWSLAKLPEQIEDVAEGRDEVFWELEKFIRLSLKANPNVLETLWTPIVLHADETAQELRAIRQAFLSKHLYKTYSGYVLSQFRRMANAHQKTGSFNSKHAMHLIRLLLSGIAALREHEIQVDVSERRDELLSIRRGELTFDEVRAKALLLDEEFQTAFESTTLADQPNVEQVEAFYIAARRRMVDD